MERKKKVSKYLTIAIVAIALIISGVNLGLPVGSQDEDPIPEPRILEPSILDCEAPRHNDTLVIYGNLVNVSAVELQYADDVENSTFEYSPVDNLSWTTIGINYNGTNEWEGWTDVNDTAFRGFDKWRVTWNTSGVADGLYYIRATMVDTAGQIGQDNLTVYFDPTPPIPNLNTSWGATVNGTITISAETDAMDITYTQFDTLKVSTNYKGVPKVKEDAKCAWNAIASLLMYWANRTDKTDPTKKPLHKFIENDQGHEMNASQLIDALVNEYNRCLKKDEAKINKNIGLTSDEMFIMLERWLEKKGIHPAKSWLGGVSGWPHFSFSTLKEEFEKGPLIVTIVHRDEKQGHAMILKSLENKPIKKGDDAEQNEYRVEFMDSYSDSGFRTTTIKGAFDLFVNMDWNQDGKKDDKPRDTYWYIDSKIQILPDKKTLKDLNLLANWIPRGIDNNGNDGWSLALNTNELQEGFHFLRATMVDSSGNNGTQITEVFVDNIPPIPGDHDVAIISITADANFINVVVENQGRYNETAYVSVYYKRIDPTLGVDLTNGTSATLYFDWNPSNSQYEITAEADQLIDELGTADNVLTITTTISGVSYVRSQASQSDQPNANWIIFVVYLYSIVLVIPGDSNKESNFDLQEIDRKQNLHANATEDIWQDRIRRQSIQ